MTEEQRDAPDYESIYAENCIDNSGQQIVGLHNRPFISEAHATALKAVVAAARSETAQPYHIYEHLKYTDAIVDAPRMLIVYADTPGRSLQGLRAHLEAAGCEYKHCWPDWAYANGHLNKSMIAELVHRMMEAARSSTTPNRKET